MPAIEFIRPVDVIVPFYRNACLVSPLLRSLEEEFRRSGTAGRGYSLILVNDSPDDAELKECLEREIPAIQSVACQLLVNEQNAGFVRSMNRALTQTVDRQHDAILLNSDTIVRPGALDEICEVADLDPMIGFVSPRSNNASLCSLPHQQQHPPAPPEAAHDAFLKLSRYLPRFHFAPVGVGFCLFIRWEILAEFGLLDESYGHGYSEENDLMMRANRCGYRAALANRAWVYHKGEASFSVSPINKTVHEKRNSALLMERYAEYKPSIERYFKGARFQGEQVLAGLLPDAERKLGVVFDFSSLSRHHNGTSLVSRRLLEEAAKLWPQFKLHALAAESAVKFHQLDRVEGVELVPIHTRKKFAVALRFAQPFSVAQLHRMSRLAPVNVYAMLDPIALDCQYLNSKNADDLDTVWRTVFSHADGVIYISDFVAEAFRRRFSLRPGLHELVAYPSLDLRDYRSADEPTATSSHILVIGNHFEHKRVTATTEALSEAFPREQFVVLGVRYSGATNVASFDSGVLEDREVRALIAGARLVVFPSTYEGFGLPVLESLAMSRPVMARSIPAMSDIREKLGAQSDLILYTSTRDLIQRLKQGFPEWRGQDHAECEASGMNWEAATASIGGFLAEAVCTLDFENVLLPRMRHLDLLARTGAAEDLRGSHELELAMQDAQAQIQDIHRSWSWRLTAPLRMLGSAYLQMRKPK